MDELPGLIYSGFVWKYQLGKLSNDSIASLSVLVPEKWSFGNQNNNGILKNYIEHTFWRLCEEGKVIEKDDCAIFNTGLFDTYYKPICAYFVKNRTPNRQNGI